MLKSRWVTVRTSNFVYNLAESMLLTSQGEKEEKQHVSRRHHGQVEMQKTHENGNGRRNGTDCLGPVLSRTKADCDDP